MNTGIAAHREDTVNQVANESFGTQIQLLGVGLASGSAERLTMLLCDKEVIDGLANDAGQSL